MPAQSPPLSPTLSAIVAGLRGSSSGIPASILPTRSPPTSAPFVKMPPPSRAKIEMSEAPKPSSTSAFVTGNPQPAGEKEEVQRHAKKRQSRNQHAGDRARLEGDVEAAREGVGGS